MEQLWAPWRLAYIQGEEAGTQSKKPLSLLPGGDAECFICRAIADDDDRGNLVVAREAESVVLLNRYPYNNGHLLIAPLRHKPGFEDLSDAEHLACGKTIGQMIGRLARLMRPDGFNVGLNLGRVAGAGLPGHLHWHIVPRWDGDTNFMPVLAGVKVIPQSLDALWDLLREAP
jgi:ATP adenylyltransferase